METVLITGGTGLIGNQLTLLLKNKGYGVIHLSRSISKKQLVPTYLWNVEKKTIDAQAIEKADYIIHLAGAGIGEKRWTKKRKEEIINSRIDSANLLFEAIKNSNKKTKAFVSASGIGYYGAITTNTIFFEQDNAANDFLGHTCKLWEDSATPITAMGIRTVIIRTGVVLGKNASALEKIMLPVRLGIASPLGNGKQYMPWIHLDDICGIYLKAIEDSQMTGVYNGVAPEHITNATFMKAVADVLKKPFLFPNLPAFILKLVVGEMAIVLLEGSKVSSQKIMAAGFKFKYSTLKNALIDCVG
ncbi:MAG: TIGR01777 family oxidoreductase [Bacteroidia bacterium]